MARQDGLDEDKAQQRQRTQVAQAAESQAAVQPTAKELTPVLPEVDALFAELREPGSPTAEPAPAPDTPANPQLHSLSIEPDVMGQPIGGAPGVESEQNVVPGSALEALLQGQRERRVAMETEQRQDSQVASNGEGSAADQAVRDALGAALAANAAAARAAPPAAEPPAAEPPAAESPAAEPAPAAQAIRRTHEGVPIIRAGMSEAEQNNPDVQEAIKNWQRELKQKGLLAFEGEPSGVFDETLKEATKEFQRRYGLEDDGVVGGKTWRQQSKVAGQALPAVESPAPAPAQEPAPAAPEAAAAGVTAEQRAAALSEIQTNINAKFEQENHKVNPRTGMHEYSFSYLAGAPEIPKFFQDYIKGDHTGIIVPQPDGGKKTIPMFLENGSINPEFKQEMTARAFDGRLEEAAEKIEAQKAAEKEQQRQSSPEALTGNLQALRAKLVDKIEEKMETSADGKRYGLDILAINIPSDIKAALANNGVYAYKDGAGKDQSIDFRVSDGKTLEAEMKELAGLVNPNGRKIDFDDQKVEDIASGLNHIQKKIEASQGRS